MRFQRPFTPLPHERAHVTAGLQLLAEYMEQAPHVSTLQQDRRALPRPDELRQVADAIYGAPVEDAFQPYFYLEQESVRVGLMALKDMRRLYGERATNLYFHELFQAQGMDVVPRPKSITRSPRSRRISPSSRCTTSRAPRTRRARPFRRCISPTTAPTSTSLASVGRHRLRPFSTTMFHRLNQPLSSRPLTDRV